MTSRWNRYVTKMSHFYWMNIVHLYRNKITTVNIIIALSQFSKLLRENTLRLCWMGSQWRSWRMGTWSQVWVNRWVGRALNISLIWWRRRSGRRGLRMSQGYGCEGRGSWRRWGKKSPVFPTVLMMMMMMSSDWLQVICRLVAFIQGLKKTLGEGRAEGEAMVLVET